MKLIDGKKVARRINNQTRQQLAALNFTPGLGVVLVGDNPASRLYVSLKERACRRLGVNFFRRELSAAATQQEVLTALRELNNDDRVHGIIVQLPLPPHLNTDEIIAAIDPKKDADGFHPDNFDRETVLPVLPAAVLELLRETGENFSGVHAAIISKGEVLYKQMARILERIGLVSTHLLPSEVATAKNFPVVIVAVGQPKLLDQNCIQPGAIIIDIGTTRVAGRTVGDVSADSVAAVAGWLTPVPGGVGPVTVATLISNVVRLA